MPASHVLEPFALAIPGPISRTSSDVKRRVSRVVFSRLKADEAERHPQLDIHVNVAAADTSG